MALDDREYILRRRSWEPSKLKGCRKSLEIYNPKEFRRDQQPTDYDKLPNYTRKEIAAQWTIVICIIWIGWACWKIYH